MKIAGCVRICTLALVLSFASVSTYGGDRFSIGGYYKNYFVAFDRAVPQSPLQNGTNPLLGAVTNRLRLTGRFDLTQRVAIETAYNISPHIKDRVFFATSLLATGSANRAYRVTDFDAMLYPSRADDVATFAIFHNLDRALISISTDPADIFVGRQAIAWGSSRVVNPSDVVAPFRFEQLDVEDRIGVDAIRIRAPLGDLGELDIGWIAGEDFDLDNSAAFVRTKVYHWESDISLIAVEFRRHLMLGFDVARSVGGAGIWAEGAYVFADAFRQVTLINNRDYYRLSVGADYSLSASVYGLVEYHFNSIGENDIQTVRPSGSGAAYLDGAVYLIGKHYLMPGLSWQVTPLVSVFGQTVWNVTDPSAYFTISGEYNIGEDIYLGSGASVGLGSGPDMVVSRPGFTPRLRSEFGSWPDFYYTSFRYYF
ncbi:MAG: hypothetical protein ACE5FH_03735 [Candidatus Zixiibacteriota bacterium]